MNQINSIATYLSRFSQELGNRILQIYPALQAPQDPVSDRFRTLLRSPFAAQHCDETYNLAALDPYPRRWLSQGVDV